MSRTRWVAWLVLGAVALGAGLVLAPISPHVSAATTGDRELANRVRAVLGDGAGYRTIHVAEITKDSVRYAGLGEIDGRTPDESTPFELGSITKTFGGLLLADAVSRGEVRADGALGSYLPELAGTPIGDVRLEELAQHRSGVPPFPPSVIVRIPLATIGNTNPYALDTPTLLQEVAGLQLMPTRGTFMYSNLGATLLGHALARAAGEQDWRRYVAARLLGPLGMTRTTFAAARSDVPADALVGLSDSGRRMVPWTSEAFAPAGAATWTTAADIARYAQAVLTGTAPGPDALAPHWNLGQDPATGLDSIGYGWFTNTVDGRRVVWHNGGTSGYRTMLAIDLDQGRAVLAVGSTTRGVDALAQELLVSDPRPVGGPELPVVGLVLLVLTLLVIGVSGRAVVRGVDRLGLVTHAVEYAGLLALVRSFGPWALVPGWCWGVLLACAVVVLAVGLTRVVPAAAGRRRWWRWVTSGLTIVVGVVLAALTIS